MAAGRALAAVALAALPPGAAAWSQTGHEQVGRIAEGLLTKGKQHDQVTAMLQEDLFQVADWETTMTAKYPQTAVLHWHHQNPEWTCSSGLGDGHKHIQCDGQGAEAGSLFCALAYFFDKFAHSKLLKHYPEPSEPIKTPASLEVLHSVPKADQVTSNYLRWLVTLLADLNQPLHWLKGKHNYGKELMVKWQGKEYTLQEFWEDFLPRHADAPKSQALAKEFAEHAMSWDYKSPPELFRDWAREAAEGACSEIYQPMEVNRADGSRVLESPFELTEELYQKWVALYQASVAKAGQHTAFVLQSILEHRRHKQGHKDGRGIHHRRISWQHNLATNAAIASVLVPGLLLAFRWHARNAQTGGRSLMGMLFPKDHLAKY